MAITIPKRDYVITPPTSRNGETQIPEEQNSDEQVVAQTDVPYHKHCQRTICSMYGHADSTRPLDQVAFPRLDELNASWKSEFMSNGDTKSISDDFVSMLRLMDEVAANQTPPIIQIFDWGSNASQTSTYKLSLSDTPTPIYMGRTIRLKINGQPLSFHTLKPSETDVQEATIPSKTLTVTLNGNQMGTVTGLLDSDQSVDIRQDHSASPALQVEQGSEEFIIVTPQYKYKVYRVVAHRDFILKIDVHNYMNMERSGDLLQFELHVVNENPEQSSINLMEVQLIDDGFDLLSMDRSYPYKVQPLSDIESTLPGNPSIWEFRVDFSTRTLSYGLVYPKYETGQESKIHTYLEYDDDGNLTNLVIALHDEQARGVEYRAFAHSQLTDVEFPNATSIGGQAFMDCHRLVSVSAPNVTSIGERAFYGCDSLVNLEFRGIRESTQIGDSAFKNCPKLTRVAFPNLDVENDDDLPSNLLPDYGQVVCANSQTIDRPHPCLSYATAANRTTHVVGVASRPEVNVQVVSGGATKWAIGEDFSDFHDGFATLISQGAFQSLPTMPRSMEFPNVSNVGQSAFRDCPTLEDIVLPKCTTFGNNVFQGCVGLRDVEFPAFSGNLPYGLFSGCVNLETVRMSNALVPNTNNLNTFDGCSSLFYLNVSNSANLSRTSLRTGCVVSMATGSMFAYGVSESSPMFVYDDNNHYIAAMTSAFGGAAISDGYACGVSSGVFGDNLISSFSMSLPNAMWIEGQAFYGCDKLSRADFPHVVDIGTSAFYGCATLTNISAPIVSDVGSWAFQGCSALRTCDFPRLAAVNQGLFAGCTSLTQVSAP